VEDVEKIEEIPDSGGESRALVLNCIDIYRQLQTSTYFGVLVARCDVRLITCRTANLVENVSMLLSSEVRVMKSNTVKVTIFLSLVQ
jgi:hypothetical protein